MVLRPAWCCVVVGVVVVAKLTEAQFVSAAAFLVGRNLVMPGVPHVTPTGRPMIVAAPTPTQPRRGGTYFFEKSRAVSFAEFGVIYTGTGRFAKNHVFVKIVRIARGARLDSVM